MESLSQKVLRKKYEGYSELILARIADNLSYTETINNTKFDKTGEKKIILPRYKIRIQGEHDESIPSVALPWAYAKYLTGGLRGESIGNPVYPKGTWVYVVRDYRTNLYYIDRISPNTLCNPDESGFTTGGKDDVPVPNTMVTPDGEAIAPCSGVYNNLVASEQDRKQNSPEEDADLYLPSFCDAKNTKLAGTGIQIEIENTIKMTERLKVITDPLKDLQTSILDKKRYNDEVIESFNNTISIYQKNLSQAAADISKWLVTLFNNIKKNLIRKASIANNVARSAVPNSSKHAWQQGFDAIINAIICIWNKIITLAPGLIEKALAAFLGKIVNAATCLVENFIGDFLGQLLGQVAALVNSVLKAVSSALGQAAKTIGAGLDFISEVGKFIESLLSIFECEFKSCMGADNKIIRYSLINGAKPERKTINFDTVFEKARTVAYEFEKLTKVPENIDLYEFEFDVQKEIDAIFDECDPGPIFCGGPDVVWWGGNGSGAQGNPVISIAGDLMGVDVTASGEYKEPPLISFEDECGNGNGAIGEVIIGPVVGGIGTLGGPTTGIGTTGFISDLDDPTYDDTEIGTGSGAGIGITHYVTVNAVAAGNRFFIDEKQQKTLIFERGNTYILDQQDSSNETHPLRFSETKNGTWGGGDEYERGVTIDGVPGERGAYSRIVVNNNTPDTLYYYCENHSKMGGKINVITPTTLAEPSQKGKDASVEVAAVNSKGGVIAIKNLVGGSGYNHCMANVPTHGGSGSRFTVELKKVENGVIKLLSINNKGSNYKIGDIVTLTARSSSDVVLKDSTGVTKVLIRESGYGYLRAPDGSMGGMRRTWANRCQTIVRRKNLDWDSPYSTGDVITLNIGDMVQLPGKPKVYIGEDFDATKLPGAQITGIGTYIARDMSNFPLATNQIVGEDLSTVLDFGFDSVDLISEKWQWLPDYSMDEAYGVVRKDGRNPDLSKDGIVGGLGIDRNLIAEWDFYAEGELIATVPQTGFSTDPQYYDAEKNILYRVGFPKTYNPPSVVAQQTPWVRAADNLPIGVRGLWSPFLINYGIFPTNTETLLEQKQEATWRVTTYIPGDYTFEIQADNRGTMSWDGVELGSTPDYEAHNLNTIFMTTVPSVEPQVHEITVSITNLRHREPEKQATTHLWEFNPAAVAWVLRDPHGVIIKSSLDPFEEQDKVTYDFDTYFSVNMFSVNKAEDPQFLPGDEWFGCLNDYNNARLLGFSDCDIRHFLEDNPDIKLDQCMQDKLNDENWGNCDGDLTVSITAPACPPDPCLPEGTYPVIACLDEIVVDNPGFGFNCCDDTVVIIPDNGAKAEIAECEQGKILRIKVTDCGSGFTELPQVFINTETGYNSVLKPILKFHRPEEIDVPKGTNVVQVIDCVGKVN